MERYLLDTNLVSQLVKGHALVASPLLAVPMEALCISVVTEAELLFGLARRPDAKRLHMLVRGFLQRVDVLPWDRHCADVYGTLRAQMEEGGKVMGSLDMLIAAHALAAECTLVSNDRAFANVPGLVLQDSTVA
jgi:tRNA(fMet)-specific endonuclease VapC